MKTLTTFFRKLILVVSCLFILYFSASRANAQEISYGNSFDITQGLLLRSELSVSAQEQSPSGVFFSPDGLNMFIVGTNDDEVNHYVLNTPYDLEGGVTVTSTLNIATEDLIPLDIFFSNDGFLMFIVGSGNDAVYQYSLGEAYDLGDVTFEDQFDVSSQDNTPVGISFSQDGTTMFVSGTLNDSIYQYSLSSAFDISSTVTYEGALNIAGESTNPGVFDFNDDGSLLYVLDGADRDINQYRLTTPFDVTGVVDFEGSSAPFPPTEQPSPSDLFMFPGGKKVFILNPNTDDIKEYDLLGDGFFEVESNEGIVGGSLLASISGETFANSGGILDRDDYIINNLPRGLSALANVNTSGDEVSISLFGRALDNQERHNLSNLSITFQNTAFTGGSASAVSNAVNANTEVGISYDDNLKVSYGQGFDLIETPSLTGNQIELSDIGVSNTSSFTFSNDGKTAFFIDNVVNRIDEVFVTTAFDITSRLVYRGADNLGTPSNSLTDIAFSNDGLLMYVLNSTTDRIDQYQLTVPFEVRLDRSTLSGSFDVSAEETNPQSLSFSRDGSKLFVAGSSGDDINQYSLDFPFDITQGVTFDGSSFDISEDERNVRDITFSPDGSLLFIVGATSDEIFQYNLSNPYDITSGVTSGSSFDVSDFSSSPVGLAFNEEGTILLLLDASDQTVYEISLSSFTFSESTSNDASVQGVARIELLGGSFSNAGGSFSLGNEVLIPNLPVGLTPELDVSADGFFLDVSFSGNAVSSQAADNISDLIFSFTNAAFDGISASLFTNAQNASSRYEINFIDNPVITYQEKVLGEKETLEGSFTDTRSTLPNDIFFSDDGLIMIQLSGSGGTVRRFDLSEPFDLTSTVTVRGFRNTDPEVASAAGLTLNPTGTKFYIADSFDGLIHQFSTVGPFDFSSSATYDGSFDPSTEETTPRDLVFANSGFTMFIIGGSGEVNRYSLSNAYDVTSGTITTVGDPLDVSAQGSPSSIVFDETGRLMSLLQEQKLYQYELSSPFNISSSVKLLDGFFDASVDEPIALGIFFSKNQDRLFTVGTSTDAIYQYSFLTSNSFTESGLNDGSIDGSFTVSISGDQFTNAGSSLAVGSDYTISNLPSGLTPVLSVAVDGISAELTISGNALSNTDIDDVASLIFDFGSSAFVSGNDAVVVNASSASSGIGIDFENNPRLTYGKFFNFEDGVEVLEESFSVVDEETDPQGITFNSDGSKLFVVGGTSDVVTEYNLTTPFVITEGVTLGNQALDFSGEPNGPRAIEFSTDGSRMFILGFSDEIYEYRLSTPFDITTASSVVAQFSVASQETEPNGFAFGKNGTKLFVIGTTGDDVNQYSLSTPFDISTAVFDNRRFRINVSEALPKDIEFNNRGDKMFILGAQRDRIYQYSLGNPFDISSEVTYDNLASIISTDSEPTSFAFDEIGGNIFVVGTTNDAISQLAINVGSFEENIINAGEVIGSLSVAISGDSFTNSGGTLTSGVDYSISNLPTGLVPVMSVDAEGTLAELTLIEANPSHQSLDNVSSLRFTFNNSAFTSGNSSIIIDAANAESNVGISFKDNIPKLLYGDRFDISNGVTLETTLDLSSQENQINNVIFNTDGSKVYIIGSQRRIVYQYAVSIPFDLSSTIELEQGFNVFSADTNPKGIAFSPDGSKMFITGRTNDEVVQYNLDRPFDLVSSSVTEGGRINVQTNSNNPEGLLFNEDGTELFVLTISRFSKYSLENPYDITGTVNFIETHSLGFFPEDFNITDFVFNRDGSKILGLGDQNNRLYQYTLSENFNPSAGVTYDDISYDLSNEETLLTGLTVGADFSKIYVVGTDSDAINQYNIGSGGFVESSSNNGSVEGNIPIVIVEDSFSNAGGSLRNGEDFSITGIPVGLVPVLSVSADGTIATLTLEGNATSNNDADDVSNLTFSFTNTAFESDNVARILGAVGENVDISIDFLEGSNTVPTVVNAIADQTLGEGF
ncbi:MAG: hypothetical protein AAFY41_00370, partial [Bacteroidota bacterium]